jgi:biotin carboxylase
MRRRLREAGLSGPEFRTVPLDAPPEVEAARTGYPCVLKPLTLSASRGVIRADGPSDFVEAFERIRAILRDPEIARRKGGAADRLLVERYLPGPEFAVEGLLERGRLRTLALFDKPDPLDGPYFEETIYLTPSRLPSAEAARLEAETAAACAAIGLHEGPVHAELRVTDGDPWIVEIAARTIGGLCSRALRFGAGLSLEALVLRHALGLPVEGLPRESAASGVMMLPVPSRGVLTEVGGQEAARAVSGIVDLRITIPIGEEVEPLPEGHRYLGFAFARGERPEEVEAALRSAHAALRFEIRPRS